jgi:hypothetical protein
MTEIQLGATLARFRKLYNRAFSAETSWDGQFNPERPSAGHCALVALDIFLCLGGEMISCKVDGISHWYNRVNGVYLDVTGDQFGRHIIQINRMPLYDGEHKVRFATEITPETWKRYKKFVAKMA